MLHLDWSDVGQKTADPSTSFANKLRVVIFACMWFYQTLFLLGTEKSQQKIHTRYWHGKMEMWLKIYSQASCLTTSPPAVSALSSSKWDFWQNGKMTKWHVCCQNWKPEIYADLTIKPPRRQTSNTTSDLKQKHSLDFRHVERHQRCFLALGYLYEGKSLCSILKQMVYRAAN